MNTIVQSTALLKLDKGDHIRVCINFCACMHGMHLI